MNSITTKVQSRTKILKDDLQQSKTIDTSLIKMDDQQCVTVKSMFFNSIIQIVKAFDGDIYGSVIRDFKIGKRVDIADINCRVDLAVVNVFTQTLNAIYDVRELPPRIGGLIVNNKRLSLSTKMAGQHTNTSTSHPYQHSIILEIAFMSRYEWLRLPCDLDVNVLAENSFSRYLRSEYHALRKFVDRYDFITERINNMKFCLIDMTACTSIEQVRIFVDKVLEMIAKGWTMDDLIWGEDSWVLNKWLTVQLRPTDIRTKYSSSKIDRMLSQNECLLCNERFQPLDIVINTRCNHNFHWSCCHNTSDGSIRCHGLVEWVKRDKTSCPCCRTVMF